MRFVSLAYNVRFEDVGADLANLDRPVWVVTVTVFVDKPSVNWFVMATSKPCVYDIRATIAAMPMTIPRVVRPERNFLRRIVPNEYLKTSLTFI